MNGSGFDTMNGWEIIADITPTFYVFQLLGVYSGSSFPCGMISVSLMRNIIWFPALAFSGYSFVDKLLDWGTWDSISAIHFVCRKGKTPVIGLSYLTFHFCEINWRNKQPESCFDICYLIELQWSVFRNERYPRTSRPFIPIVLTVNSKFL